MRAATMALASLVVVVAPGALAADEAGETHAIVEASTSQLVELGRAWELRSSYSVSALSLGDSGQGFGARLTLLPAPSSAATWEISADVVARFANEGPWYLKGLAGTAVTPSDAWWPPHVRAGVEVGLTAIRGGIGLEAGAGVLVSCPAFRPAESEVMAFAGMGILFGFGAPASSAPGRVAAKPAGPIVRTLLAAGPAGGLNTCEGSQAAPQCVQALLQSEGIEGTSATAPPAPAPSATPPLTTPASAPSSTPAKGMSWKAVGAAAASLGAALGLKSAEERRQQEEYERLMKESARTLEEVKRQPAREAPAAPGAPARVELPAREPGTPMKGPGEKAAPRVDSEEHSPRAAPGASTNRAVEEPDNDEQTPLELSNPYGQHGKPDHKATVERLKERAAKEFPNMRIETGSSIRGLTGINRRPDVWVYDEALRKVLKVYEAARFNPDGSLAPREQLKKNEYDKAGIPSHFEPVNP